MMPVYDKPMIYYPLSTLMTAGISEILIISTPHDLPNFEKLLGDGAAIGCKFTYAEQAIPNGLAQAFVIGEEFIGDDSVALVLGDNIFFGSNMDELLQSNTSPVGGVVFAYHVSDPERYGVVEFDKNLKSKKAATRAYLCSDCCFFILIKKRKYNYKSNYNYNIKRLNNSMYNNNYIWYNLVTKLRGGCLDV